jgi:hypothetical protein
MPLSIGGVAPRSFGSLRHLTHVGTPMQRPLFHNLARERGGWTPPEAELRSGYGFLNLFDRKPEPVIDSSFESGNMLAAVAKSWGGRSDTSRGRLGQKNRI